MQDQDPHSPPPHPDPVPTCRQTSNNENLNLFPNEPVSKLKKTATSSLLTPVFRAMLKNH